MLTRTALLGLEALTQIACSTGNSPVRVSLLAEHMKLSVSHVETLVKALREGGFIESIKGPGGGYRLCQQPSKISIAQVCSCFEKQTNSIKTHGSSESQAAFNLLMQMEEMADQYLSSNFLIQLIPDESRVSKHRKVVNKLFAAKTAIRKLVPKAPKSVFHLAEFS